MLAVLRMEKETMQSRYLEQWEEKNKEKNLDEMAHCSWAVGDGRYLEEMWKEQNPDGGFGITGEYMSEGYDTLLVLMAAAASGGDVAGPAGEAAAYLLGTQNKDGGFGAVRGKDQSPDTQRRQEWHSAAWEQHRKKIWPGWMPTALASSGTNLGKKIFGMLWRIKCKKSERKSTVQTKTAKSRNICEITRMML